MALVSVSEYARMRGLNKSTVSRQLHKVFPNRGTDAKPLIDVDEADAARDRHLNPLKARQGATAEAHGLAVPRAEPDEASQDLVERAADPAPRSTTTAPRGAGGGPGYANVASLQKFWQAQQTKQRALKEAGLLTPTADVVLEQTTAARRWRDRLLGAPREWAPVIYAEMIAGATESRLLVKLDELVRQLVISFAQEARAEADSDADDRFEPGEPADAAGDFGSAEDGLDSLGEGA
jgi:hypothetical protein